MRCNNPNASHYDRYGGRGITVCARWTSGENGKTGYECFFEDMGPRPSVKHSIDRIDNDGGYYPGNCRWAVQKRQVRNSTAATMIDTPLGRMSIIEASEVFGVAYGCLRSRLRYGWEVVAALTTPTRSVETIMVRGNEMTFAEAAAISPVGEAGIKRRLRQGWSVEDAVFTPRQKTGPKARSASPQAAVRPTIPS